MGEMTIEGMKRRRRFMPTKSRLTGELAREVRDVPPEVVQSLVELARAVKRSLTAQTTKAQVEKVLAGYGKKAAGFDFGLTPDTDYAEELMEVYLSTFPRTPVED
jgi:hypothetical protein